MYADHYYNPGHEVGYAGANQILKFNRRKEKKLKSAEKQEIYDWLKNQDAYTLHKPIRKKFPRLNYNVTNIDQLWEIDLVFLSDLKKYNDGFTYIVVVIDVLSKYVWVEPIKDKTMKTVTTAFENILKRSHPRLPVLLQSDSGTEFLGSTFQALLRHHNIQFRVTRNPDVKAAVVERVNRTLKERMWRYFTHRNTKRYIDVLQDVALAYNNTIHSSTKFRPSEINVYNSLEAAENIRKRNRPPPKVNKPKFTVGTFVRISRAKGTFEKGYASNYSEEIFKVTRILKRQNIFIYELSDLADEPIDGFFYPQELRAVGDQRLTENFNIKQVLSTRGRGRKREFLVSWVGYPDKFNSWISGGEVNRLIEDGRS